MYYRKLVISPRKSRPTPKEDVENDFRQTRAQEGKKRRRSLCSPNKETKWEALRSFEKINIELRFIPRIPKISKGLSFVKENNKWGNVKNFFPLQNRMNSKHSQFATFDFICRLFINCWVSLFLLDVCFIYFQMVYSLSTSVGGIWYQ